MNAGSDQLLSTLRSQQSPPRGTKVWTVGYAHSGASPTAGSWLLSLSPQQDSCLWTSPWGGTAVSFIYKGSKELVGTQFNPNPVPRNFSGCPVAEPLCSQCSSIPDQGTRSHIPQLKITHTTTKTRHSQINIKYINIFKTQQEDVQKNKQTSPKILCQCCVPALPSRFTFHRVAHVGCPSCKSVHTSFYLKPSSSFPLLLE